MLMREEIILAVLKTANLRGYLWSGKMHILNTFQHLELNVSKIVVISSKDVKAEDKCVFQTHLSMTIYQFHIRNRSRCGAV